jgi:hypothetical protein
MGCINMLSSTLDACYVMQNTMCRTWYVRSQPSSVHMALIALIELRE